MNFLKHIKTLLLAVSVLAFTQAWAGNPFANDLGVDAMGGGDDIMDPDQAFTF